MNPKNTLGPKGHLPATNAANQMHQRQYRDLCGKCGARRIDSQIGLEPTPDAYVQNMVRVFREVRRVLKDDGTCWLNLGDSFLTGKQLGMIPARVALALQSDGWILRMDLVWAKPNPMPENVTDRPTKAHEYLFLLVKSGRYYYNAEAIQEPLSASTVRIHSSANVRARGSGAAWKRDSVGKGHSGLVNGDLGDGYRNRRSVWMIGTKPYPGAHFAVMPEALVEPCVRAGSRSGDIVLDPFAGSGTVARVALRLGRRAVGCDLNPAYLKLADERTQVTLGLPLDEGVA